MAQNTLTQNIETATEVIKEVKETITRKGVEIPEGTHATQYPGYIEKMTSQTELEEFKEQVVLKGVNESEIQVSAPVIELNATDGNINLNPTTGEAQYKGREIATINDIPDTSDFVTLDANQTITGLKTFVNGMRLPAYSTGGYRISINGDSYFRHIYFGENKTAWNDGLAGGSLADGSLNLTSAEGGAQGPRIQFHYNGAATHTAQIVENYTGILSVPQRLAVGTTRTTALPTTATRFYVSGDSYITGSILISSESKTHATDGLAGTVLSPGIIELQTGGDNGGFIDFHYGDTAADYTSRIIESARGSINLVSPNGVRVGVGQSSSVTGYQFYVSGTSHFSNAVSINNGLTVNGLINGATINSTGDGNSYLSNDGSYKNLSNTLPY
ncbi:MAG: hypothetical protein LUE93_01700, partial [Bacteroides sp.]|nr:hypothetical protein [Bacteroides sp.]